MVALSPFGARYSEIRVENTKKGMGAEGKGKRGVRRNKHVKGTKG